MKILKFFQPNCAPCVAVDNFLKDQGVEYTSIDVTKDAKKQ
ncbi:glutaredoxin domain-containing protein [Priestia megaterium]